MDKVKITFVLPITLQKELKERIIKDSYDMKQKSHWIAEAIVRLLTMPGFPDLVKINDEMKGFEKLESVVISRELKKRVNAAIIDVRRKYPMIEGVQSRIFRTAIMQRLLRY
ncbi:MAG TPA: hypothetical protein VJN02_10825 [Gammaproteobacteria bacterium]|nr:hypothetical protein [Gammaproteobacteria bacterium]